MLAAPGRAFPIAVARAKLAVRIMAAVRPAKRALAKADTLAVPVHVFHIVPTARHALPLIIPAERFLMVAAGI